MIFINYWVQG